MAATNPTQRYKVDDLLSFANGLFRKAGCDDDKAATIAQGLVEADLLGHTTHGLQLAPAYLAELESGRMTAVGEPLTINDRGATVTWDGQKLPGIWLAARAVDLAVGRARQFGTASVAIRKSHHIGCLAVFLQRATDHGLMVVLTCSDPGTSSVAPYGGRTPVMTPNPFAIGIPTGSKPIWIDTSASITTNRLTNRLRQEGKPFPGKWALTADGEPTDDPNCLYTDPPGTLLPSGGADHGHKGYAVALLIEALTQGLSGYGRADQPQDWGASVFVQVHDPAAFAGTDGFIRQTGWLAGACQAAPPVPGVDQVRLPGERAMQHKRQALAEGVELYPSIMPALSPFAEKYRITTPVPSPNG